MPSRQHPPAGTAGFSLVELMVAMAIVLVIMGGAVTALTNAYRSNESARGVIDVNNNLRIAADLMVRDLIQVGQGLPTGRLIQVPNGVGALQIQRPHPQGSTCTQWRAGAVAITTLAVDSTLDSVPVYTSSMLTAHTARVALPAQCATGTLPNCTTFVAGTYTGGLDVSNGTSDDVRVGDLMMFTKGSVSALVYVTAVDGNQTFTFGTGDPMHLNQFGGVLNGTADDLEATAPTGTNTALVSRIRMISYYLDTTLDPATPRLMRHLNWGDPAAAVNQRARTVAFGIDNLQFTYDMLDGVTNPSNVRMVDADFTTGGACAPSACSPNQIRKANLYLAGRSTQTFSLTKRFFRNALGTQVSLRSLALVDRYR
jgi:prepilin-type N-terminal cleavage/methylation domain-containing protein